VPYLAVLVTYGIDPPAPEPSDGARARAWESGWQLAAADLPLFNALRGWRAERASRAGIAPYLICTDKQLEAMVSARPQSLTRLGAIDGIGKTKLEKHGQDLLAMPGRPRSAGVRHSAGLSSLWSVSCPAQGATTKRERPDLQDTPWAVSKPAESAVWQAPPKRPRPVACPRPHWAGS